MNAKVINKKHGFEPVTIEVKIETAEELCSLWHRLNMAKHNVKTTDDSSSDRELLVYGLGEDYALWGVLNNLVNKFNLVNE